MKRGPKPVLLDRRTRVVMIVLASIPGALMWWALIAWLR